MNFKKATVNRRNTTVLFVHGAMHNAWCWEKFFFKPFLEAGYDVCSFNLPMHEKKGSVKGMNALNINHYVDALEEVVKKIDTKPVLIGHSMGGAVVQKYLEKFPSKATVLLASCSPRGLQLTGRPSFKEDLKLLKVFDVRDILTLNSYKIASSKENVKKMFFSENISELVLNEVMENLCSESIKVVFFMAKDLGIKINHHTKSPMLVLGAKNDYIISIEDNAYTANFFNGELKILDNIAHDMMLDTNHEKASQEIINWLNQNIN